MVYKILFTDRALRDLDKFDNEIITRIVTKLNWYAYQNNPISFASRLRDSFIGQYRYRIGDYRAIFDVQDSRIVILRIGHRSVIYK